MGDLSLVERVMLLEHGDLALVDRVADLEAVVKRLDELIAELKEEKKEDVPKRRGNPNWVKKSEG